MSRRLGRRNTPRRATRKPRPTEKPKLDVSKNWRSDDERYADNRYYGTTECPLMWLGRVWFDELRPFADGPTPPPAEILADLRGSALADISRMRDGRSTYLIEARADLADFLGKQEAHWQTAFDLLEIFLWNSVETLVHMEKHLEDLGVKEAPLPKVMMRLCGRATRIGREVGWLLRGGYPEAAHARWRTLHEVAVTASLMRLRGEEAARRLLAHELLMTLEFNERQRTLAGPGALSDPDYASERELRASLLAEFGSDFGGHYGWAAGLVNKPRPTFEQIEQAAGLSQWRQAYKNTTYPVRSTSRPLHDEIFNRHGEDVFAPTSSGLATPAIMTIRSVMQANCAILTLFVKTLGDSGGELKTALLLDAVAREAMDAWASHEWGHWGMEHIPG